MVEADKLLSEARVQHGDVVIAMRSSGLHSNGYSLARYVLLGDAGKAAGLSLASHVDVLGRTLGEELLEPTRIYALDCLDLMDEAEVHVFSHVTGGGLAANLARVLPGNAAVDIDRATWKPQPIFELIRELGGVERLEIEKTLNQGIGMFAVVEPDSAEVAIARLGLRGIEAWVAGTVRERRDGEHGDAEAKGGSGGAVTLVGEYRA